ncbi:MAG: hypothetical protein HY073_03260 [Deltaproteobacteria bacterium]|nr:hypothetical protein [Deltaproteobacteria bacterium]
MRISEAGLMAQLRAFYREAHGGLPVRPWAFTSYTTGSWVDLNIRSGTFVPKIWEEAMRERKVPQARVDELKKENMRWVALTLVAAGPNSTCRYLEGDWSRCLPSSPPSSPEDVDRYEYRLVDGMSGAAATFYNADSSLAKIMYEALLKAQLYYGMSYFAMYRLAGQYHRGEIDGLDPGKHGDFEWCDMRSTRRGGGGLFSISPMQARQ